MHFQSVTTAEVTARQLISQVFPLPASSSRCQRWASRGTWAMQDCTIMKHCSASLQALAHHRTTPITSACCTAQTKTKPFFYYFLYFKSTFFLNKNCHSHSTLTPRRKWSLWDSCLAVILITLLLSLPTTHSICFQVNHSAYCKLYCVDAMTVFNRSLFYVLYFGMIFCLLLWARAMKSSIVDYLVTHVSH